MPAAGDACATAVAWARAEGIVNGVTGTVFQPDAPITQAQFAAMLTRYAASEGVSGAAAGATLSQGMTFAQGRGLLNGSAVTAGSVDYALTKLGA